MSNATIAQGWAYQYEAFSEATDMVQRTETAYQPLPFMSVCPMSRALGETPAEIAYTLQDLENSTRVRRRVGDFPSEPFPDPVGDMSFGVLGALVMLWFGWRYVKSLLHRKRKAQA